jgi:hypothetical protein
VVDRIEPRKALKRVVGWFAKQGFDLNCRTSPSSQRLKDQGLCGSVFRRRKLIHRRLAQTVHHSGADFGYVAGIDRRDVREGEFAGHMIGVIRKVNSKSQRTGDWWGRHPRQLD